MIRVQIDLEEIAYSWHVVQIFLNKDGERYSVVHVDTPFASRAEAGQDARERARKYLLEHFGIGNGDIMWEILPSPSSEAAT
jgi:hypothetical protein